MSGRGGTVGEVGEAEECIVGRIWHEVGVGVEDLVVYALDDGEPVEPCAPHRQVSGIVGESESEVFGGSSTSEISLEGHFKRRSRVLWSGSVFEVRRRGETSSHWRHWQRRQRLLTGCWPRIRADLHTRH